MDLSGSDRRHLSEISTLWTVLRAAHADEGAAAGEARAALLDRYGGAVYRYLRGALRDPEAADEAYQEFALRLVRGQFRRADPGKGRFRDFLKTAVAHLITDARKARRRAGAGPGLDPADLADASAAPDPGDEEGRRFLDAWRAELLDRAWNALEDFERRAGQPLYTVLRLRADAPEIKAPEMAGRLAATLGRDISPEWVHKRLHLARQKYIDLLLEDVALSVEEPGRDAVEGELIELGLLEQCRGALDRGFGAA